MSYSTLKKALQLFEEPVSNSKQPTKKTVKKSGSLNKSKNKSQRAKNTFKVPHFMKTDSGKSIYKIKEQIKNNEELNLLQINLDRLQKLDRTSCVDKIASNLVDERLKKSKLPELIEETSVFTDEDFKKFERDYFQN